MPNLFLILGTLQLSASAQQESLPQCQCIPPRTGTHECQQYDSRYQAATLEEAMASFPDLSLNQDDTGHLTTLQSEATCQTQECLDCQKDLRKKLERVGLMAATIDSVIQAQNTTSTCKKYRFARKDEGVYEKNLDHDNDDDDDSDDSSSDEDEKKKKKKWEEARMNMKQANPKIFFSRYSHRHKRQMPESTIDPTTGQTIVGERFVLSCSSKGVTTDTSGTVSLCSSCWIWRRLPSNYSPQYINELVCDATDSNCLSGYATCGIGHRTIEVVRNDSGTLTTVALSAGSYCECRVAVNSAIQSLVTGAGLQATLPALNSTPVGK
ncbi:hypothetical protein RB195_012326 [Necator americanus]|uniref:Uncharacterized protein n=1 Tax=Necator americanus TaxID=51031 RepID=A0ABR1D6L5_NECAM